MSVDAFENHELLLTLVLLEFETVLQILFLLVEIDIFELLVLLEGLLRLLQNVLHIFLLSAIKLAHLLLDLRFHRQLRRTHQMVFVGRFVFDQFESHMISQ